MHSSEQNVQNQNDHPPLQFKLKIARKKTILLHVILGGTHESWRSSNIIKGKFISIGVLDSGTRMFVECIGPWNETVCREGWALERECL